MSGETLKICANCNDPLNTRQKKFCCRSCEQKHTRREHKAWQHYIKIGNITIPARLVGDTEKVEWILPGCEVTGDRVRAERAAKKLFRQQNMGLERAA